MEDCQPERLIKVEQCESKGDGPSEVEARSKGHGSRVGGAGWNCVKHRKSIPSSSVAQRAASRL